MARSSCPPTRLTRPALALFAALLLSLGRNDAADYPTKLYTVHVSGSVSESPPRINLSWPGDGNSLGYEIYRRTLDSGWNSVATLGGDATGWSDGGVAQGIRYEYRITKRSSLGFYGYGYLASGIRAPALDRWGKIILVVENSLSGALSGELARLESDLTGEGWIVVRRDVSMYDSPPSVKQTIKSIYDSDPANVQAVFLLGHIPVPYSGNIFPDGHPNHQGAWPADVYYGDMDGQWTDYSVNSRVAERDTGWNVPGDGKFDQGIIPGNVKLMVGRVDLNNMTCYANKNPSRSEVDLMRQYLNKDHAFRIGDVAVERRALICDNFADKGSDPISGSAWRTWSGAVGVQNVDEVGWDGYLPAATSRSYLWSYATGGGSYYYATGVATSDDFALHDVKAVFTMFLGSYFGDWNNESNFLRAALGSGYVLTSTYSGAPHTINFPMTMGFPIGYCIRLSQNNATNTLYDPWVQGTSQVHISLMGDPTLRMHPVRPPGGLNISTASGGATLNWGVSPDSNIQGYYIYRASTAEGPYTRVGDLLSGTSFTDNPPVGNYTYMVRAVKLEQPPAGTYLNPSVGVFASATVSGSGPQPPGTPALQAMAVSDSRIDLQWTKTPNSAAFRLQRNDGSGWNDRASFDGSTTSFSDNGLDPARQYSYRIQAVNGSLASGWSAEVSATTSALPSPLAAPTVQARGVSESQIDLSWDSIPNAKGYKIERIVSGIFQEIARVGSTEHSDTGLAAGAIYSYRARSFNDSGDSPYSAVVQAATLPSAPPISDKPLSLGLQNSSANTLRLNVRGDSGQRFVIHSSIDLQLWQPLLTNALVTSSLEIAIPVGPDSRVLYLRAVNTR